MGNLRTVIKERVRSESLMHRAGEDATAGLMAKRLLAERVLASLEESPFEGHRTVLFILGGETALQRIAYS